MIYAAADIHLRECTWKSRPDISGDQYNAWFQLCLAASRDPEGVLVLAGDIFDTPFPTGLTEAAFSKGLGLLKGRACYFIPGNHDDEEVPRAEVFGAIPLSPDKPVKIGGMTVAGIPFTRSAKALHETLGTVPAVDMLVLHTGFRHLLGFDESWQISSEDIPEYIGMVLSGHVHVHSEQGKVYSPGSLALHRADELDKGHGYFVIDPWTKSVSWREVSTRRYASMSLDEGVDQAVLEDLADRRLVNKSVVLLDYRNEDTAKAEALQEIWKDRILFMCNARSSETIRALEEEPSDALDIDGVVRRYLSENLDERQLALAGAIMEAADPSAELEKWLKENLT